MRKMCKVEQWLYLLVVADFSSQELETLICSFSSSWLQMFVAEAIFKKLCLQGPASACAAPEPLSLQKIVSPAYSGSSFFLRSEFTSSLSVLSYFS